MQAKSISKQDPEANILAQPKKDANDEWKRLHNEEFHNHGHIMLPEGRSAFKILTRKPTEKRSFGRSRRRWEDSIKMDLQEIGINTKNWVDYIMQGISAIPSSP